MFAGMVSLYESCRVSTKSNSGMLVCRPGKDVLEESTDCGLAFFSPCAGNEIHFRADIRPARLEFFCIGQVVSGEGWYWTEAGGRTAVSARQIFFIRPGMVHDIAAGKSGMVVDQVFFCGPLAETLFKMDSLSGGIREGETARRLLPVIESVSMGTPERQLRALSGLTGLLADLTAAQPSSGLLSEEVQIDRLCAELKRKPEKWWDGAQMAAFCNLSEAHLRRLFKVRTGVSPKAYQDQVRVEKAEELLKNGFSVRMVSEILGYSDPYHFSRRFKSILGYPPRDCLSQ
jgi:AraC-like DNA-binding protein